MRRPKVLVIGEAVRPSGYATVLDGLLPHLSASFDLRVFALSYSGPDLEREWEVYGNRLPGDPWGVEQVESLLARLEPDIVWIVYDVFVYLLHAKTLQEAVSRPRTVLYSPIDGCKPDSSFLAALAHLDRWVLFNETARRTVLDEAPPGRPISLIPHGVDTATFRPLDRRRARREIFPDRPELDGAFIVLNANRNSLRKRLDLTIQGFARFAHNKPDARLCLHSERNDFFDLAEIAESCGIKQKVIFTAGADGHPALSSERLALLYNACDIGINTSRGEGWGLVAFEHAATGAAQIVPRHSACAELWEDAALFLEPVAPVRQTLAFCEYQDVSEEGVCEALELLYGNPDRRLTTAAAGYRLATSAQYQWCNLAVQWRDLFREMCRESRDRWPQPRTTSPPEAIRSGSTHPETDVCRPGT